MFDGKAFGADVVDAVRGYVDRSVAAIIGRIEALERRQPERGEPGERGADGAPGRDGERGLDGKDGQPGERGPEGPMGREGPAGRDGRDGQPGRDGERGEKGDPGEPGPAGEKGDPGPAGERGERGFGLDDFDVEQADDRTVRFKFTRGDVVETYELSFPVMIYRGVFQEGAAYVRGDTVTWAGSLWHCDADEAGKPGDGAKGWTLAAKRGRDGRDGKDGERGLEGPAGRPGRDLTQLGADGGKW
jgi:collagen type III alpha